MNLVHEREKMVKTLAIMMILDLIMLALIFAVFVPRTEVTKACISSIY